MLLHFCCHLINTGIIIYTTRRCRLKSTTELWWQHWGGMHIHYHCLVSIATNPSQWGWCIHECHSQNSSCVVSLHNFLPGVFFLRRRGIYCDFSVIVAHWEAKSNLCHLRAAQPVYHSPPQFHHHFVAYPVYSRCCPPIPRRHGRRRIIIIIPILLRSACKTVKYLWRKQHILHDDDDDDDTTMARETPVAGRSKERGVHFSENTLLVFWKHFSVLKTLSVLVKTLSVFKSVFIFSINLRNAQKYFSDATYLRTIFQIRGFLCLPDSTSFQA
jgi:hypothetical protein